MESFLLMSSCVKQSLYIWLEDWRLVQCVMALPLETCSAADQVALQSRWTSGW